VGRSWRMGETYVKIKGKAAYLYRAVDKEGYTIDFLLTPRVTGTQPRRAYTKPFAPKDSQRKSPSIRVAQTQRPLPTTIRLRRRRSVSVTRRIFITSWSRTIAR
jgi:hypothetical protein